MIAGGTTSPRDTEIRERILNGFRGDVPTLRPSLSYRIALGAVALAVVLLPVVYVGLVLLAGWLFWSYTRFFCHLTASC